MWSRRTMGAGAACLLALTSCTANPRSAPSAASPHGSPSPDTSVAASGVSQAVQQLDCEDIIGAQLPTSDSQIVLGAVALPTSSAGGRALQTFRTIGRRSEPRLFAKTALLVRK